MVGGVIHVGLHPIQTVKGVGSAIRHPIRTVIAIKDDVVEKSGSLEGQGELVGDVLITVATAGTAKAIGEIGKVAQLIKKIDRFLPGEAAKVEKGVFGRRSVGAAENPIRTSDVRIRDLNPLDDSAHRAARPGLRQLTDDELLNSARNPVNGDTLARNTRTGKLHDGNGRAIELQRRAADPTSRISPDDLVPVEDYTPDTSMFWDLD